MKKFFVSLSRACGRFKRDQSGVAMVEFALCLPIMLLLLAAAVIVQDAIRMGYLNHRASYTLSDMVSREDASIDAPYFDGLNSVFEFMTAYRYPVDLRISKIECTSNCASEADRVLEVCWSQSSTDFATLATPDLASYSASIPLFVAGDTMIMTETYLNYTPPAFPRFFEARRYEATAFTRPRITEQIRFDTGVSDEDGNTIFQDCFNNT